MLVWCGRGIRMMFARQGPRTSLAAELSSFAQVLPRVSGKIGHSDAIVMAPALFSPMERIQ